MARLLAHIVKGLSILRSGFDSLSAAERSRIVQLWSRQALDLMGVELTVRGEVPAIRPLLLLANHISWLDILVINAALPSSFVSKSDVKHWPVIGRLVEGAGTLFIERERRRDAMRVVHQMVEALRSGAVVAIFPEGTTSDGSSLLPFHANLLQAAVVTDAPVALAGLTYLDARTGQRSFAPAFTGSTSLPVSVWRALSAQGLRADVHFGEVDASQGRDRRTWANALRDDAAQLLNVPLND